MKQKLNTKAETVSNLFYFFITVVLVVSGLFFLYSLSVDEKEANLNEIAVLKQGYQTTQLARTFIQTPLNFSGKTKTVAEWVNIYFQSNNYTRQHQLRVALFNLASKTLRPHLNSETTETKAIFSYYVFGRKINSLQVSNTELPFDKQIEKNVVYSGVFQENASIQIPTYTSGLQTNPADKFILFEIISDNN